MKLDDALLSITRLGLDTPPIIYLVEANPTYDALVSAIFTRIDLGEIEAFSSTISLAEVLVQPLKRGNVALADQYRELLLHSANFTLVSVGSAVAERAAELRARYNLRIPDAIQIAAALDEGCEAFLTNDTRLSRVTELPILVLDDLET